MRSEPFKDYILSNHALFEMKRRGLSDAIVRQVLDKPEQQVPIRSGRIVLQSKIKLQNKIYLLRVFVDIDRHPAQVVTAYLTSKISKYWRENQ